MYNDIEGGVMMDTKKTAEFLKSLRKAKGYTQAYVADELMVSVKTISRWESGEGLPDINIITSVAEFYEVTVDELLKGEKNTNKVVSNQTVELKNKEKNKLIKNNMMNGFNKYFYASLIICLIGLILGIIIGVFASILIGIIILIIFDVLSLIPITSNYIEVKKEIKEEDNEELSKGMKLGLDSIKRKFLLYLDVFTSVVLLPIFLSMYTISVLSTALTSLSIFIIILLSYLYFRYHFKRNILNKYRFFHIIAILISIMSILLLLNGRMKVSGIDGGWIMEFVTLLFYYNNTNDSIYIFRIIALVIMISCILLFLLSFKKNNPILSLILMIIGIVGSGLISLDFYLYKEQGKTIIFEVMPNILVLMFTISSIILLILCIKNRSKLNYSDLEISL